MDPLQPVDTPVQTPQVLDQTIAELEVIIEENQRQVASLKAKLARLESAQRQVRLNITLLYCPMSVLYLLPYDYIEWTCFAESDTQEQRL